MAESVKVTFTIPEGVKRRLEALKQRLRREGALSRSVASETAIVVALVQDANFDALLARLRR